MILVAPTSYKATIGAAAAAAALAAGVRQAAVDPEVVELPLSDGGPGLIDALALGSVGGARPVRTVTVTGPLGAPVEARVLLAGDTAVLESADACGLHLVPPGRRDPLLATTRGLGELLRAAALPGVREIACGLGGSATVDGGAGLGRALGFRLLDAAGRELPDGGGALQRLARIEPPAARQVGFPPVLALCDVDSPLLGPDGAAAVFGPQKGATPAGVAQLEQGLRRLAEHVRLDLGVDVSALPGAGAAGGLGAGLVAFAGARITGGSAWVLEAVGFEAALARARLVLTGEGAYDGQSALGKLTGEVIRRARARGIPVLLLAGSIRVPLPPGVEGVTGDAGEILTPPRLAELAAAGCARLLAP